MMTSLKSLAAYVVVLAASTVLGLPRHSDASGQVATAGAAGRTAPSAMQSGQQATALFAGGCFWCMEPPFDAIDGVVSTTSGYTGGQTKNPTYEQVSEGRTGHTEAIRVVYDPSKITYEKLLEVFWRNIDPLDGGGQFCDRGPQYRAGVFYQSEDERRLAEDSKQKVAGRVKGKIVTEVSPAGPFYEAEDYHQDYYKKNPVRYKFYKWNCGRDQRLEKIWGKLPTS
jgi:peptide-methionine (S)-S-oxide reductase